MACKGIYHELPVGELLAPRREGRGVLDAQLVRFADVAERQQHPRLVADLPQQGQGLRPSAATTMAARLPSARDEALTIMTWVVSVL